MVADDEGGQDTNTTGSDVGISPMHRGLVTGQVCGGRKATEIAIMSLASMSMKQVVMFKLADEKEKRSDDVFELLGTDQRRGLVVCPLFSCCW